MIKQSSFGSKKNLIIVCFFCSQQKTNVFNTLRNEIFADVNFAISRLKFKIREIKMPSKIHAAGKS